MAIGHRLGMNACLIKKKLGAKERFKLKLLFVTTRKNKMEEELKDQLLKQPRTISRVA